MKKFIGAATAAFWCAALTVPLQAQLLLTGPNAMTFSATAGGSNPVPQSLLVRHTGETAKSYTVAVSTITGGNWLSASTGIGTTPSRLNISASPQGLPPGVYGGTVQINSAGVPPARVDVTLSVVSTAALSASPSTLSFLRQLGSDAGVTEQLIFVGSSGSPATLTVTPTTTDGGSWLQASVTASTTPGVVAVRINPAGLTAGNYNGSVAISAQGLATLTVPVSLSVSSVPFLQLSAPSLNLAAVRTGPAVTQSVTLTPSTGALPFTVNVSTASGGNWLIVTPLNGAAPGNLDVSANPSGLPSGLYSGTIQLNVPGAANPTVNIPVSFTVTDFPTISVNQRSLSATVSIDPTKAAPVQELTPIQVAATTSGTTFSVSVRTLNGGAWLVAGPANGAANGTITSVVDTAGLASGTYRAEITVTGPGNSVTIPVTLTVTSSAQLVVDPATVTFNLQKGQTPPSNQVITVSSTGAAFAFRSALTSITPANATWLNGGVTTGTTPSTLTLGVNSAAASALANGTYNATLTFSGQEGITPAPPANPTVNVVLNVSENPLFNVSPQTLDFVVPVNSAPPAIRPVAVTATDNSSRAFTAAATTASGGNWLLVGPTAGNTPTNLNVQVAPLGLGVGVYEGTIQVSVPTLSPTAQSVRVRLIVQPAATIAAAPASLSFTQSSGGAPPAAQTVNVTSTGSANFQVTASTTGGGTWLSVNPTGGSAPGALTVSVNGSSLAAGTYTGSIGISSSDVNNGPVVIPVTFTVTAPALTLTPASVTLLAPPGSTTPVTQQIAVAAGNAAFIAQATTSSGGSWLSVNPQTGNAPANVTVSANPTGLPAGTYQGFVTFTAAGVGNSPQTLAVTLNVATAPPPGRQVLSQIADGSGWKTTITLVNLDTAPATFTLSFYASDGSILRLPIEGETGRLEAITRVIPVGGSRTIVTAGTDNALSQGWAELSSGQQVSGLGVFRQRVAGRPDQEAGVSVTSATSRFVLPFDNTQGFVSSMALVNTNASLSRAASATPREEAGNTLLGDSVNLPARGHTAFEMAQRFPSMSGRRGSVDFVSAGADFSALGLRFNPGGAFTSLPFLERPQTASGAQTTQVISQIADGGGEWKTTITLVNVDTVEAPFTLRFWRQQGTNLTVPIAGGNASDVIEGTIPVGGTRVIETAGGATPLVQGWAELTTNRHIGGLAVFRQRASGRPDQEAAVTLTTTGTRFVLPFDNTDNFVTSMALVNASATIGAAVNVVIRDEAGQQIGTDTISLTGRGHVAFELRERMASTRNRRGTAEFTSTSQVTGLGLRFNPGGAFTSFPVLKR
ncbi:MAG: hypothetical protein JNK48_07515 [Bryobacterales bacterium]|nr:hypothetical protein [Bryobacterales bacterium]